MQISVDATPPILVTAERWERDYRKSTSSIDHFSEKDFEVSGATTVSEFLKLQSGLNISTSGAFGKASSLFLRGTSNRHTLVFVDGIRVTDLTAIGGGARTEFLSLSGIETIEILKGSQSVLYGPEAIGGVIKITTKKSAQSQASFTYGSYKDKRGNIVLGKESGNNFYRINVDYRDVEGISAYSGGEEKDGLTSFKVSPFYKRETDLRSITLQAEYQDNNFEYDDFGADAENETDYKGFWIASILEEKGLGFAIPRLHLEYRKIDREVISRGSFPATYFYDGSSYKGELTLENKVSLLSLNGRFLVGALFEKEMTSALDSKFSGERKRSRSGAFLNGRLDYKSSFFEAGARYEDYDIGGSKGVYRIGVGFNFLNWTLKASQATGFKVASLYQSFSSSGNENLRPETSLSKELGIVYSNGKSLLDLSVFYLRYSNFIDYDMTTNSYGNLSDLKNEGAELTFKHSFRDLDVSSSYQYLQSRIPSTGKWAPRRARQRVSLSSTYYLKDYLSTSLNAVYVGERRETDDSRMPSYLLFNSAVSYEISKNRFTLNLNNILDRDYEEQRSYNTPGRNFVLTYSRELF